MIVDGWVSWGKFGQEVLDSGTDCEEGTGCVGDLFANAIQLLYFFAEYSKFQVSFRVPACFHIQKL